MPLDPEFIDGEPELEPVHYETPPGFVYGKGIGAGEAQEVMAQVLEDLREEIREAADMELRAYAVDVERLKKTVQKQWGGVGVSPSRTITLQDGRELTIRHVSARKNKSGDWKFERQGRWMRSRDMLFRLCPPPPRSYQLLLLLTLMAIVLALAR